jgi:DNA-binding protein WhiA
MSFSSKVKDELLGVMPGARHCKIAEIAAVYAILGERGNDAGLSIRTENEGLARKFFTLLGKAFNIEKDLLISAAERGKRSVFRVVLSDSGKADVIRKAMSHPMLLSMECCRRAFLRGAFLAAGSISAPEKYYHLEIVCPDSNIAETIRDTMRNLGLLAKIAARKGSRVVYLKEGEQIVQILGEMGAGYALMNLENVRILRDMRGRINRQVNCETANLGKAVAAGVRQTEDIIFIRDHAGLGSLPKQLREMAEVRLAYPDVPLRDLGEYLDPKIGKSGVNHRLKKLSSIAADLRKQKADDESQNT